MAVYGQEAMEELLAHLPPVSLFQGPPSVGKWTAAEYLRWRNQISEMDVLRIHRLTVGNARQLVRFASTAPTTAKGKLVIVRLDKAAPSSLNVLLKILEELPSSTRVILISSLPPMETVASRAVLFRFSYLDETAMALVLVEKKKFSAKEAVRLSKLSRGQVQRALDHADESDATLGVLTALEAIRDRNPHALDAQAKWWTEAHTELLAVWCTESITRRWSIFKEEDVLLPGKSIPLKILLALSQNVRPKLVVRANLMSVLRGAQ